ncbi:MAG TPA: oxidoreductase, partial [Xanthomonadaceae bacterium]|nr:oxidoreductase [Xanthomonadaceae bacterium]
MDKPFNLALLGYGYVGRVFHAPLIGATPGLALHAVVSSQPEAVRADLPAVRVSADRAAVLADPQVDAVVIATPNQTHAPIAREALAAGKHVLVDKPFTVTSAEARRLVAAAATAGRVISVFQNRRWDADFLTVRRLLDEGRLGEIAEFHSHFDRHRPQVRDRWRESDVPGGGLWFDLGPHLLDQALQLFGPPDAVQADIARQRAGARSDDYFDVTLHYPALRAVLHAGSLVADNRLRFAVHGTRGSFVKHGLDTQEDMLRAGRRPGGANWGVDPSPGALTQLDEAGASAAARSE